MLTRSTRTYFSKRKVLFTYLATYLIIITALFSVIGSFSYSNIIKAGQESVKTEIEQTVNNVVSVMETNLRDVLHLQSSFYTNSDVSRLRKLDADFQSKEFLRFLDMSNKLSNYTSTSQFLDRVTIYFYFNHLFIASDMLDSRPEIFYKLKFPNESISYSQWRSEQIQHRSSIFYVTESSMDGYVNLYYRLPILDTEKGVTVITTIKIGELIESLGVTDLYTNSALIITSSEGNILYSNKESASSLMYLTQSAQNSASVTLEDTSYEWRMDKLSLLDWTIHFFVSTDAIYADSRSTQLQLLGLYSLVLVSSILLAVLFSKRISDPVSSLLHLVDRWDHHSSFTNKTVEKNRKAFGIENLQYVLRRVSDMFGDYMHLTSNIHDYKESSREIFYNRLLKGEVISADEIKMIEGDLILDFRYYTVAIARIISYNNQSIDMAMYTASEMFSHMRENGYYFCKTALDRFAIIICRDKFIDQSQIADMIKSFMDKIYMDSLVSLRWGIGNSVTNYDQIFVSYRNAEYALYNMDVLDSEVIEWYDNKDKQKNRLTYNFDDAQRFYTLINNGDSEIAVKAIKELVERNKEVLHASRGQRTRFISMLSETTLLLVSKFTNLDNQLENEIERILRQMKRAESTNMIVKYMTVAVNKLCEYVNTRNDSSHKRLIDKITTFLDDNYSDPDLSLTSISQSMRLTESYISSFFKQNNGMNIQNYIEQKRMIKAVELLKETNLTIAEIAKQVGYNNTNTFYKAFRRNYSMTPKECREDTI